MAGLADILSGLNQGLSDPSNAGVMGFAQGLLQAGAPHMLTPVPMGQALSQGMASSQQYQGAALKNAMARLSVPFQQMKVMTFAKAMKTLNDPKASPQQKAAAQALAANLISPGMGPSMLANDPTVQAAKTTAVQGATPHTVAPSDRMVTGTGAPLVRAQGSLPTGTAQGPGGAIAPLPGALPAIEATAGAQSGGAAAGSFPFQQALKQTGYFKRSPGQAGAFSAPAPRIGAFSPVSPAIAALRQRAQGISQAAPNASPAPQPSIPAPQGVPPSLPVPAAPAASGGGLTSQGMTPSQVTGQQTAQKLATEQLAADVTAGQEAQQRVANLEELNAVASGLKTGPGMDAHVAVLKALASVPGAIGVSAGKLSTITNAQIFNKQSLNLSLQTVSQAGQHAYDAYKSVMNAFPELSKTNMANAVVTAGLLATARYQADRGTFASKWQQQNQGMGYVPGKGTAEGTWTQNAPFMAYFMNALPPEAQKMIIAKARTNATLRIELQRGAQGWQWLNANGY